MSDSHSYWNWSQSQHSHVSLTILFNIGMCKVISQCLAYNRNSCLCSFSIYSRNSPYVNIVNLVKGREGRDLKIYFRNIKYDVNVGNFNTIWFLRLIIWNQASSLCVDFFPKYHLHFSYEELFEPFCTPVLGPTVLFSMLIPLLGNHVNW